MNPADPVQRQLEAYNARDLARFVAEYSDDVQVYKPPAAKPVLSGKAAFAAHYASNRFNLPGLHATVVARMVSGNTVVDHEHVAGLKDGIVEAIAVYRVDGGRITTVWFY
ncbi:MAG TPA: nuclear transport factor 2 family protein [Burkholderiaceae bacterium]